MTKIVFSSHTNISYGKEMLIHSYCKLEISNHVELVAQPRIMRSITDVRSLLFISLDLSTTICLDSLNLSKQMQTEDLTVPASVDQLLSDYAKRFHQIKTPRKLLWKKNLGTVKVGMKL